MGYKPKTYRTPVNDPQKKRELNKLNANKKAEDIDSLYKIANNVNNQISAINSSIDVIESDISSINNEVTTINTELDNKQDLLPSKVGNAGLYLKVNSTEDDFEYDAPSGGVTDGDKGDIIVSSGGTVWTIDPTSLAAYLTSATAASTYYPLTNPSSYISASALTPYLPKSGGTMTGNLILNADPTSSLQAATKQYVDNLTAGINFHAPCHVATTGNLSATYSNGTSGVGATLTATSAGVISIDSHLLVLADRVLVWQQSSGIENGIYEVTDIGSISTPWVLTRATDADNNPSGELLNGDFTFIQQGTTYGGFGFILNTTGTITVGVTAINYVQFNAAQVITAGYGLQELSPNVLSVDSSVIATTDSLSSYLTSATAASTYQPIGTYATGTGTANGTNTGDETTSSIKTKLGPATATDDGYLRSSDWNAFNAKQDVLGFTPEDSANKSTSTSDSSSSVKFPVWSAIVSFFSATKIRSILGITTLSGSNTGDQTSLSGISDTKANFNTACSDGNFVFTGDSIAATNITEDTTHRFVTDTEKSTWNAKQSALTNPVTGTGTINQIAAFDSTGSTITSLTTATYPSLTELSYVKGVTSSIQTQLNGKQASGTYATGTGTASGTNTGDETTATIKTKLGAASGAADGYLTSTDWTTFNGKQAALTVGYGLTALPTPAVSLTSAQAFASATTSISAATYADVTGASITLAAGTWLIMGNVYGYAANLAFQMNAAITDGANAVITEGTTGAPASGTASVNQWASLTLSCIVTPSGSTTYKLRAARGNTTLTNTFTVANGAGTGVTNNATTATNKGTGIRAIRIA